MVASSVPMFIVQAGTVTRPFMSNSLSAAVCHADNLRSFNRRLNKLNHILVYVLVVDFVVPFRSGFAHKEH